MHYLGHSLDVADPIRLWYTFGNHMHWVDMQWLWGYHVLPGSTFDMLKFCRETGAKGNVNFDGIGYEKMAAEAPEALQALREAAAEGLVDPVGGSYGQPYGLFHGGESNIRQRIYGARTVMRLLGVRPQTFWEEEFDFFPQLPQLLRGCGFENASLYFQWTWHTPEVPFEASPVVWWEGIDGSRLLTATRNRLNLHQWPEDFQMLLNELAESGPREVLRQGKAMARADKPSSDVKPETLARWENEGGQPAEPSYGVEPLVLQWLELMPSPDWMCRSELLIPKLRELLEDDRFEVIFGTLGDYLSQVKDSPVPIRRYGMHEVWHGMSMGKNGSGEFYVSDGMLIESQALERMLQRQEALHTILGLFGRPYANWDVYPVWEMEEAWRNLLAAQHHDNYECEGLCGHVAGVQYETCRQLGHSREELGIGHLVSRVGLSGDEVLVFNATSSAVDGVPPFGYAVMPSQTSALEFQEMPGGLRAEVEEGVWEVRQEAATIRFAARDGAVSELPFPRVTYGSEDGIKSADQITRIDFDRSQPALWLGDRQDVLVWLKLDRGGVMNLIFSVEPLKDGQIHLPPGLKNGAKAHFDLPLQPGDVLADTPYAVDVVIPGGRAKRKYPTGDWMTSPQWFEEIDRHFTASTFVDLPVSGGRMALVQEGPKQWFWTGLGVCCQLGTVDPWDEAKAVHHVRATLSLRPHQGLTHAELWEEARQRGDDDLLASADRDAAARCNAGVAGDAPRRFSAVACEPERVRITAIYREAEDFAARGLDAYAGAGMGHPFVLRLVEFDGEAAEARIRVAGTVARAFQTNLMGEVERELEVELMEDHAEWEAMLTGSTSEVLPNLRGRYSTFKLPMRGREIATVYLDVVEGRKQPRDLDAHRDVWATVHRVEE